MTPKNETVIIDMKQILKKLVAHKIVILSVATVVFILSCIYIVSIPRYYASDTKLAPEIGEGGKMSSIGSIASSLGIDLAQMPSADAITPLLYPSLIDDDQFVAQLFTIQVKTLDGKIRTNYYNYLALHQKKPWWDKLLAFGSKYTKNEALGIINAYQQNKEQNKIAQKIRNDIKLNADSKNGVLSISVESQDPLICKTVADSVRNCIQTFITNYRTGKALRDLQHYQKLSDQAKADYEKARRKYAAFADANTDVILQTVNSKTEDLENDMQIKYNTYTSLNTQYLAAKAKLQERTPAFTILKGATVPLKPAGPKRILFVLTMVFLSTFIQSLWILRKEALNLLK